MKKTRMIKEMKMEMKNGVGWSVGGSLLCFADDPLVCMYVCVGEFGANREIWRERYLVR